MMLQAPETELLQTVTSGRTPLLNSQISFRSGHDVLGELTNLIWGQIKATVLDAHDQGRRGLVAELPLIINENRKYLTFGAAEPALCLSYKIREADTGNLLLEVHQKVLVYNDLASHGLFRKPGGSGESFGPGRAHILISSFWRWRMGSSVLADDVFEFWYVESDPSQWFQEG